MSSRRTATPLSLPGQIPRLVFKPQAYQGMQKGINTIADAIRPTLGPLPRFVAVDPVSRGNRQPDLLDDGGLIARRILQLPDPDADMGAMFLRQLLWKQREEAGDGTATTAVIFQAVYNEGIRYIAAGGNPMRLRHYLTQAAGVLREELENLTVALNGQEQLTHLAQSVCDDEPLAQALGEVFDIIGEHGLLEIRSGHSRSISNEFLEGCYFKGGLHAGGKGNLALELTDAAIFISDLDIDDPQQAVNLIALAYALRKPTLVIIARSISEKVTGLLASVSQNPQRLQAIAVKSPDNSRGQAAMLDDLAVLCGGRVFLNVLGDNAKAAKIGELGAARRVWADRDYFGIIGGKGSPHALRAQHAALRKAFDRTQDIETRKKLRERIGRLMGGAAVLHVGGTTDLEINMRKVSAQHTAEVLRGALAQGTLAGGGAALLACRSAMQKAATRAHDLDERMAYQIIRHGLEAPARAIVENAGYDAEPLMRQIKRAGTGFEVITGKIVDMRSAGIIDSAEVTIAAVHDAISSAALALTVDVLVHHRAPTISTQP